MSKTRLHRTRTAAGCILLWTVLLSSGCATYATQHGWQDLGIFTRTKAPSQWRSRSASAAATPEDNLYRGHPGITLEVPMRKVEDRVYWDADLKLDLSRFSEFSLDVQVDNPAAVSRVAVYLKSGEGWFGGWFHVQSDSWQTITLSRADFAPEGDPLGWDQIKGMRIALWKASDINTRARIAGFRARSNLFAILRNSTAIAARPDEKAFIERSVHRLSLWLRGDGLNPAILDDSDLIANGVPHGSRLLILPYNPEIPTGVAEALKAFTANGGKLIVAYALEPPLQPLLGLSGKRWMKAEPSDVFTSIRIDPMCGSGLPATIRQESWNATIPELDTANVLGTWENGSGTDTGLPAVTLGTHGAFIGHTLTNVDRDTKMELLLALTAMLVPEAVPLLGEALSTRASRLFQFDDWPQTRAYLEQTARRHQRVPVTTANLELVEQHRQRLASTEAPNTFGQYLEQAKALQQRIRQTYYEAVAPPSGGATATELRGVWSHDAGGITGQPWQETTRELKKAGFNTLFVNHLWGGVAYYPSEVLPVAQRIAAEGDLLQQSLEACRAEGIELHVWQVLWVLDNAPEAFVAEMKRDNRLIVDRQGNTKAWLCPTHPDNMELAIRAAREVVQRYPVNGLHLDYVRYPDADSCMCTGCARRFREATGRAAVPWPAAVISGSDRTAFLRWRRQQITATVTRMHKALKAIRPGIQLSAAVWGNWPEVRDSIGQDWAHWCREGLVDFICPMNYVTTAQEAVNLFQKQQPLVGSTVSVYPGIAPTTHNLPPEAVIRQIDNLRQAGATGFVLFDLDRDLLSSHLPALRAGATSPPPTP